MMVNPGCDLTEPGPRVSDDEHRQAGRDRRLPARRISQDGYRAGRGGCLAESSPMHRAARQRGVEVTRADGPGVMGDARQPARLPYRPRTGTLRVSWPQPEQRREPG